jgi:hypothetical protein
MRQMRWRVSHESYVRESKAMGKTSPWHSILRNVHHNNTNCNTGNNIERENRRSGTGGKPLCSECAGLS